MSLSPILPFHRITQMEWRSHFDNGTKNITHYVDAREQVFSRTDRDTRNPTSWTYMYQRQLNSQCVVVVEYMLNTHCNKCVSSRSMRDKHSISRSNALQNQNKANRSHLIITLINTHMQHTSDVWSRECEYADVGWVDAEQRELSTHTRRVHPSLQRGQSKAICYFFYYMSLSSFVLFKNWVCWWPVQLVYIVDLVVGLMWFREGFEIGA